jgi:type IV pilus assembly protein PilB
MDILALKQESDRIGDLLIDADYITAEQLQHALSEQSRHGQKLGYHLVRLGYIDESVLARFVAKQYQLPFVYLDDLEIDTDSVQRIPLKTAVELCVMPVYISSDEITIAMSDPTDISVPDKIKFITGLKVRSLVALKIDILNTIKKYYKKEEINTLGDSIEMLGLTSDVGSYLQPVHADEDHDISDLKKATEEAPIVKLTNFILASAINKRASDIHIEPGEKTLRVRFRIDGALKTELTPPKYHHAPLVSRIKIMCGLDISERRLPQDGRMVLRIEKKNVDFRVSFITGLLGEKVVIRILNQSNLILDIRQLGFEEDSLKSFEKAIYNPNGMILVTGPTGSGKTTTLYSALNAVNNEEVNIMTAEDPVEYQLEGINQFHMHEKIGFTFASALRSFLRQDPDIIMVGEIRDLETANIAIRAALTGHLVFSTLHTIDAPSTIVRLVDMGIEPLLVSSSVIMVIAQRLLRAVCAKCKEKIDVSADVLSRLGLATDVTCYRGSGCEACNQTGYKGRVAIYETMPVSETIKELIIKKASVSELKREAVRLGMDTLRVQGLKKAAQGITTIEEALRTTTEEATLH